MGAHLVARMVARMVAQMVVRRWLCADGSADGSARANDERPRIFLRANEKPQNKLHENGTNIYIY